MNYWANPDELDNVDSCVCIANNCDVITGVEEDVPSYEIVTAQEEVLVEVNQSEAQIKEVTVDTKSLCMNAGDDEVFQ